MEALELVDIVAPAVAAAFVVTAVHAPLGIEVLKRGIVFIDLATAQIVGLAVILLGLGLEEPPWPARQAAAFAAAIAGALFFRWIERKAPGEQEAVIGSAFIVAASVALLAIVGDPHGGEALRRVLSGEILFVTWGGLAAFLPVYAAAAALWFGVPAMRRGAGFFITFALAVTASVQLVGVYVVFASLILPALAARAGGGYDLRRALASGAAAVAAGVAISVGADLPAGPVLVACFALSAAAARTLFAARPAPRAQGKPRRAREGA